MVQQCRNQVLDRDLLAAQEGHPEVLQQLSSVLLGEGASVRDECSSKEDVTAQGFFLFTILSH